MKVLLTGKMVMYYGQVVSVPRSVNYIAANRCGCVFGFNQPPDVNSETNGKFIPKSDDCAVPVDCKVVWSKEDKQNAEWLRSVRECQHDQLWMLSVGDRIRRLCAAAAHGAEDISEECIGHLANRIVEKTGNDQQYAKLVLNEMIVHAVRDIGRGHGVLRRLCDKVSELTEPPPSHLIVTYFDRSFCVPVWAQFLTMDADGAVYAYTHIPRDGNSDTWIVSTGKHFAVAWIPEDNRPDWRHTLRLVIRDGNKMVACIAHVPKGEA